MTLGRGIQQAAGLPKPVGNPVALAGTQGVAALPGVGAVAPIDFGATASPTLGNRWLPEKQGPGAALSQLSPLNTQLDFYALSSKSFLKASKDSMAAVLRSHAFRTTGSISCSRRSPMSGWV